MRPFVLAAFVAGLAVGGVAIFLFHEVLSSSDKTTPDSSESAPAAPPPGTRTPNERESYPSDERTVRARPADSVVGDARVLKIYGRVSADDGRLLSGVRISSLERQNRQTTSGEEGAYSLELEHSGPDEVHTLRFRCEAYHDSIVILRGNELGEAVEWELDVAMESLGSTAPVYGVITSSDRASLEGETVHLQSPSLGVRFQTASDPGGRFAFPDVRLGDDYRLWVHPKGEFRDFVVRSVAVPRDGLEVDVVLEPLEFGRLGGRAVDSDGHPLPRLALWLRSMTALGKSLTATCDDDGRFQLDRVPEGRLILQADMPERSGRFTVRDMDVVAGAEHTLDLVVDSGPHELSGVVTDGAGDPLERAQVELYWNRREERFRSTSYRQTRTGAEGRFKFARVGAGPHKLKVSSRGYHVEQLICDIGSHTELPVVRLRAVENQATLQR